MAVSDFEIADLVRSMSSSDDEDRLCYSMFCDIPLESTIPYIFSGPCGWFPGYSWRLAPIYHQPPWSWEAFPSTLRRGLSHFMVTLKGLNQIVRFGSMVCLLAGPAFYLRQWLHPNCSSVKHCGTFSTWLSRLKKQLKVAVLTHHFGVLPCPWLLVESFGIRPFVWFSIVLSHYLEIAQVVLQKNISRSSNTSWGLPVSLTTTSSSCFPRTFRTAGGCWTLTG